MIQGEAVFMQETKICNFWPRILGSTGRWPVVFGGSPNTINSSEPPDFAGEQPALRRSN
jgi:hypothetical protein